MAPALTRKTWHVRIGEVKRDVPAFAVGCGLRESSLNWSLASVCIVQSSSEVHRFMEAGAAAAQELDDAM
jgi:hypothetical protein